MLPFVELTLVDLSLEVESDSNDHGRKLKQIVADGSASQRNVSSSQLPRVANALFQQHNNPSSSIPEKIRNATSPDKNHNNSWLQESVLKYLKLSDQYLAFTSILLKSKAFYVSLGPRFANTDDQLLSRSEHLPIIQLPRTEHGKPFIPPPFQSSEKDAHAYFPFSISHQFPYAGMARLVVIDEDKSNPRPRQFPSSLLVGLDIVVFEDYNPRLYESTMEFVCVFQDMFTDWEWQQGILKFESYGSNVLLKELYLRWAMKEAYTKAMGLGMSIEFSSFETHLHDLEIADQRLSQLIARSKEGISLTGFIRSTNSQAVPCGDWEFFFKPLYASYEEPIEPVACACVCVGPKSRESAWSTNSNPNLPVCIKSQSASLDDLIDWHNMRER